MELVTNTWLKPTKAIRHKLAAEMGFLGFSYIVELTDKFNLIIFIKNVLYLMESNLFI